MRKFFLILSLIAATTGNAYAQAPNASDGHTPIPMPPPTKKPCKLVSLTMPCCSNANIDVASVAQVQIVGPFTGSVVYSPETLTIPALAPRSTETVSATACGQTLTTTIVMVNENRKAANSGSASDVAGGLKKTIDSWRKKIFENVLASALNGGVAPCEPIGNKIPIISLGVETGNLCCSADSINCIKVGQKFYGEVKWAYGVKCHFPVFGVPYVASLDAVLSAGVSLAININAQTTCTKTKLCAGVDIKGSVGGGVGGTVLAGAVSADLQLVVDGFGVSGELCFYPLPVQGCIKANLGQLKVVGTVETLWGLTANSVDYTIFDGYTTPTACYPPNK